MGTLRQTVRARKDAMFVLQNIVNGETAALWRGTATTVKAVTPPIQGNDLATNLNVR